jgi:hypothetical protein
VPRLIPNAILLDFDIILADADERRIPLVTSSSLRLYRPVPTLELLEESLGRSPIGVAGESQAPGCGSCGWPSVGAAATFDAATLVAARALAGALGPTLAGAGA